MFKNPLKERFPLVESLKRQNERKKLRFHVPAHTSDSGGIRDNFDLTELPGLDNLFEPEGVIYKSQKLAAEYFKSEKTYYLVNGSSSGIIAAVMSLCCPGEKVILGRNVHRSVITGLILSGAVPCFIPVKDYVHGVPLNIRPAEAEKVLSGEKLPGALIVTSPTYWGISPDMGSLRRMTGFRNIPLIVDEAHGGHFVFNRKFPPSASSCPADLWVNSAHKTLGALTPGAFLHQTGERIDTNRLKNALSMIQTSSPPYHVLASLELLRNNKTGWDDAIELGFYARRQIKSLKGFSCLESEMLPEGFSLDPLRLTVFTDKIALSGFKTAEVLREEQDIEVEMAGPDYFVVIIHRNHCRKDIDILLQAMKSIEESYYGEPPDRVTPNSCKVPFRALSPREANDLCWEEIPLKESCGRIAAVTVSPFPPGIPVLIPGEVIEQDTLQKIIEDISNGLFFLGLGRGESSTVTVVKE